jgi:uncharacterized membrane protein YgcG
MAGLPAVRAPVVAPVAAPVPRPNRATRWRAAVSVLLALAAMVVLPASSAWSAGVEHIVSFTADYTVEAGGGMDVVETLVWDFGASPHHGIKRYITTSQGYDPQPSKHRIYDLTQVQVSSPSGAPTQTSTSQFGANTIIRVGDPNTTISGTQTYVVRYHLGHVVNSQPDDVELYWNVTGAQTSIPTDAVNVTVHGPAAVTKAKCFSGAQGSTDQCTATPGQTARFSASGLAAYSQVSVVAAFPTPAFTDTSPALVSGGSSEAGSNVPSDPVSSLSQGAAKAVSVLSIGGGIGIPVLAAVVMGFLVRTRGRDEQYAGLTPGLEPAPGAEVAVVRGRSAPVAVQFQPPAGVQAGLVGTVLDEEAGTIDVSATVVDLAVRGYLRIEEVQSGGVSGHFARTDWQLTKMVPTTTERLDHYEQIVLDGLFDSANPVLLSALKNRFHGTLVAAQSSMYDEVVRRGWFRSSPQRQRRGWSVLSTAFFVAAFAAFGLAHRSAGVDTRAGVGFGISSGYILVAGLVLAGLIVMVLGRQMAARTARGSAVLAQSLGFKQYLLTAEANQIAFEEAQDVFSRYLPYAIVFGVAQRWAKVFSDVAQAASAAGYSLGTPGWYVFAGAGNFGSFAGIADGVDSFSTTASGTFTSTPGSSGGSGFSGGGFSGGGGGGGGSSSW